MIKTYQNIGNTQPFTEMHILSHAFYKRVRRNSTLTYQKDKSTSFAIKYVIFRHIKSLEYLKNAYFNPSSSKRKLQQPPNSFRPGAQNRTAKG